MSNLRRLLASEDEHTVGVKKLPWDKKNDDVEQHTEYQLLLIADDLAGEIAVDDNDQGYELTFFNTTNKNNVFKYILKTLNASDVTKFRNKFLNKVSPMFTSCDSEKCLVDKDVVYHGYRK